MVPIWFDTPLDGPPNSYLTSIVDVSTSLFWREDLQQWVIGDGLNIVELGGTRDNLPTGSFAVDNFLLTISEGFCDPNQNPNA